MAKVTAETAAAKKATKPKKADPKKTALKKTGPKKKRPSRISGPTNRVWTDEKIAEIKKLFDKYIEETDVPIIAEFAYKHGLWRQKLYEFPALYDSIKIAIAKKETALEKLALTGKVNCTMAIFSLKQLGWKDRMEMQHSLGVRIVATDYDEKL